MLNTVAVGTDGTPTASTAGAAAIDVAERNGARLVLISSYRNDGNDRLTSKPADAPLEIQWALNPAGEAETILTQAADEAEARGLQVTKLARFGDPAEVLCELAAQQQADVLAPPARPAARVVVGNKGMHRRLLGSVPNSVAHKAPRSVLIVKTT
jgi:nucleotide-binding universal stress UspA family protein